MTFDFRAVKYIIDSISFTPTDNTDLERPTEVDISYKDDDSEEIVLVTNQALDFSSENPFVRFDAIVADYFRFTFRNSNGQVNGMRLLWIKFYGTAIDDHFLLVWDTTLIGPGCINYATPSLYINDNDGVPQSAETWT